MPCCLRALGDPLRTRLSRRLARAPWRKERLPKDQERHLAPADWLHTHMHAMQSRGSRNRCSRPLGHSRYYYRSPARSRVSRCGIGMRASTFGQLLYTRLYGPALRRPALQDITVSFLALNLPLLAHGLSDSPKPRRVRETTHGKYNKKALTLVACSTISSTVGQLSRGVTEDSCFYGTPWGAGCHPKLS